MKRTIEYKCKCASCEGSGIYVGFAEKDGFGVICHVCKGSGFREIKTEYEDFEGREVRSDIKRVLQSNPGIGIGVSEERGLNVQSFGGMPYKDWVSGKPFPAESEMRAFTCPAWWYQSVDYEKKPDWDECVGCGSFSSCKNFSNKSACWSRWDTEQLKSDD